MINIEKLAHDLCTNPINTKLVLIRDAEDLLAYRLRTGTYSISDLLAPNYSDICKNLGWPNFKDDGIYEQCINMAINVMLMVAGGNSRDAE